MEVINLCENNSLVSQYMSELRDKDIQQDRLRFRANVHRLGQIMAYEISKKIDYKTIDTVTPLAVAKTNVIADQIVLATILRAGLPFHNGMLSMLDQADSAFIAAYRKYDKNEEDSVIRVEYYSSPDIEDRILILCDPLLATGESIVKTLEGSPCLSMD